MSDEAVKELSLSIAETLMDRELLVDNWEDGMTISRDLSKRKTVLEAAIVIDWVLRTGKFRLTVEEQ